MPISSAQKGLDVSQSLRDMGEFEERISISATREKIWDVLADIGSIHRWNPGVVQSRRTNAGDIDVGARRRCELGGRNFLDEEVIEFERPHKLSIRITDSSLPFKSADIRFSLESAEALTTVTVSPKYELKFGWFGRILDAVMVRPMYRNGMVGLLHGLKEHVEQRR